MTATATIPFSITSTDGRARTGTLRTAHGEVETPTFMAVGTLGGVKAATVDQVRDAGISIVLGNTYHLLLRPSAQSVATMGGLHRMSGWTGPMLTDSGGFQVFSLAKLAKTDENGVSFASHIDGSKLHLSPESSMEAQRLLGADICMAFDDVPALPATPDRNREACERSMRWAERCKAAFTGTSAQGHAQLLFGIQQGGLDPALRAFSSQKLTEIGFPGYAIGGLSVGESPEELHHALDQFVQMLPDAAPRYVMGIGWPQDLLKAIACGADMFDCVLPTRCARHGLALTSRGRINVKASQWADDTGPLDPTCRCFTCATHCMGYVRHLHRAGEQLAATLLTIHNLSYYAALMHGARAAIRTGTFADWRSQTETGWQQLQPEGEP
jgi:queuine tRNA-ribosyltransferase